MPESQVRQLLDALRDIAVKNSVRREFFPENEINELMTRETVRRVFGEIVRSNLEPARSDPGPPRQCYGHPSGPKRKSFHLLDAKKWTTVFEHYRKILALLVFIGKEEYIMSFLHRADGDRSLPLSEEQLKKIDPYLENSDFIDKQYSFIAVNFYRGMEKEYEDQWILPFVRDVPIRKAEGAFGKIFEVEIHESYYDRKMWLFGGDEKPVFARKELMPDQLNDEEFELEKNALKTLQAKHPNIVPLLGSYKYGGQYNFIFPRADCDLDMYFHTEQPPTTDYEMFQLFERISKLASALDVIHNCSISDPDGEVDISQIGYHRDLKPKNVLKLGNIFMISDLGLARFKENHSVSKTKWVLGVSTYGAPECKPRGDVNRLADIWSLGCIFSEVVTFALRGKDGIDQFSRRRKRPWGSDCDIILDLFYEGNSVTKEVLEWFEILRTGVDRNPFIVEILELVEEMLTPVNIRPRAAVVITKFSDILERERKRRDYPEPTTRAVFTDPEDPRDQEPRDQEPQDKRRTSVVIRNITEPPPSVDDNWGSPPLSPQRQPSPTQPIVSPILQNYTQEDQIQNPDRRNTSMTDRGLKRNRSNSGDGRCSSLTTGGVNMKKSRSDDGRPKTTGPPPLLYKVPGFLAKSQKGKSPFGYLKEFDTVFLIDDSESMSAQWDNVAIALYRFIDLATLYDGDGVDLYFTDSEDRISNARTAKEVFSAFRRIKPAGSSPLTLRLDTILSDYVSRFNANRRTKRLNLIVITNGDITPIESPADPIINCAKSLDSIMAPTCQVGVQFALIGSDEEAQQIFMDIDDELWKKYNVRDMVDTTPYDPDMDGRDDETLLKIMCGAVNRLLDNGPDF